MLWCDTIGGNLQQAFLRKSAHVLDSVKLVNLPKITMIKLSDIRDEVINTINYNRFRSGLWFDRIHIKRSSVQWTDITRLRSSHRLSTIRKKTSTATSSMKVRKSALQ